MKEWLNCNWNNDGEELELEVRWEEEDTTVPFKEIPIRGCINSRCGNSGSVYVYFTVLIYP